MGREKMVLRPGDCYNSVITNFSSDPKNGFSGKTKRDARQSFELSGFLYSIVCRSSSDSCAKEVGGKKQYEPDVFCRVRIICVWWEQEGSNL